MRPDLQKVIVERPRVGGHSARRNRKKTFLKDYREDQDTVLPVKEGISRWAGWETKEQTDVLGPLYGFLRKNVGRPWDKIWSEICEHSRGYMGQHLKTHVRQLVVENAKINKKGEVTDDRGYVISGSRHYEAFYVHPETRLLSVPPVTRTKYHYRKPESKIVRMNGRDYFRYKGIWYRVTTAPIPEKTEPTYDFSQNGPGLRRHYLLCRRPQSCWLPNDAFGFGGIWTSYLEMERSVVRHYGAPVYCTSKQQANSKECRKLNQLSGIV